MKKLIKVFTASFSAMCIWLFYMSFGVYADIIDEPPVPRPEPAPSSDASLYIIGLIVVCVVIASVIILKKMKNKDK